MGFRDAEPSHLYHRTTSGEATVRANGRSFGRGALRLNVQNNTPAPLDVILPLGSFFLSNAMYEQSLFTQQDVSLTLEPHELRDLELDAYCGVSSYGCPGVASDGQMELTSQVAPEHVCASQTSVWEWTRAYEPGGPSDDWAQDRAVDFTPAAKEYDVLKAEFPDDVTLHGGSDSDNDHDSPSSFASSAATSAAMSSSSASRPQEAPTPTPEPPTTSESGDGGSWFGSWFGGDASVDAPAAAQKPPDASDSGWMSWDKDTSSTSSSSDSNNDSDGGSWFDGGGGDD